MISLGFAGLWLREQVLKPNKVRFWTIGLRFFLWRGLYWLLFVVTGPVWLAQALAVRKAAQRFPAAPGPRQANLDVNGYWCNYAESMPEDAPELALVLEPEQAALTQSAEAIQVIGLGDSIIAGVGVAHSLQSLSAMFAQGLARTLAQPVSWSAWGSSGLNTAQVLKQLWPELCQQMAPTQAAADARGSRLTTTAQHISQRQVILISLGANDISGLRFSRCWRRDLCTLHRELRQHWPQAWIIFLGLPPFAVFPLLPLTLRYLLSCRAHAFDALLELCFASSPRTLCVGHQVPPQGGDFAADGYHPNAAAVARWATALTLQVADLLVTELSTINRTSK